MAKFNKPAHKHFTTKRWVKKLLVRSITISGYLLQSFEKLLLTAWRQVDPLATMILLQLNGYR